MKDEVTNSKDVNGVVNQLVDKGHHLHELLLYLMFFFSTIYTVVNFFWGTQFEMIVTMVPMATTVLCFYLLKKEYYKLSKAINLIQVTIVVAVLCLYTTPATGVLAFYVPIFIGILITFQGKDVRLGYGLTIYAFLLLFFLLVVQYFFNSPSPIDPEHIRLEWVLNFTGASLATIFEMIFILKLSESIQKRLIEKGKKLRANNEELVKINYKFDLITTQSGIGIWELDLQTGKANWNNVLIDQYGVAAEQFENNFYSTWTEALHPDDHDAVVHRADLFVKSDRPFIEEEYRIINKISQEVKYLKCLTVAERDQRGEMKRLIGSVLDITKEKNLQVSLSENNAQLKKANAELDNFVYSVSHDLRSPLLSVKGLLSLIFQHSAIDSETSNYLSMADKSIDRLDETISEILEYSRNARLEINKEPFSLRTMLEQICDDLHFSAEEKFQFKIHVHGEDVILADRNRISTVLRNLIGNAVKYRKKNIDDPYVNCELVHEPDKLVCVITDNGEGISETDMPRIFDMFYRGNTNTVGTGLGLYICREVVNKMDGELMIESVLGSGTCITVRIPL